MMPLNSIVIDLDVPFSEKDEAKRLGARWNPERRKWFIPAGVSPEPFQRWLKDNPALTIKTLVQTIYAPVWLLTSAENCYRCHRNSVVFSITGQAIRDYEVGDYNDVRYYVHRADRDTFVSISNLEIVDDRIAQYLSKFAPNYRMDYSKTQDAHVYMNHCQYCGAKLGDFYMHNEPGGAFLPDSYQDIERMKKVIFENGEFIVKGSIGLTSW